MFKMNPCYCADGYKTGHHKMLAPGTTRLYGTWIPRSLKYAPNGVEKVTSFGQQFAWMYIHDAFKKFFFDVSWEEASVFVKDMSTYLGLPYDGEHIRRLHELGYLPIRVKSLPEGVETKANIPHMTFINTNDGFAWLPLFLETMVSSLAWKPMVAATIARQYHRNANEWVMKTDPERMFLADYMCHDFSARGLSPHDMVSVGMAHAAMRNYGSDTLVVIPASRYYYGVGSLESPIVSVNASEHSVSTTKIFTVGEQQMLADWMDIFPTGILSVVSDTFDLWKLITEYLPALKEQIMARDGKLVIRPDSGNPVDIICGESEPHRVIDKKKSLKEWMLPVGQKFQFLEEPDVNYTVTKDGYEPYTYLPKHKGVIELLWDIFGGTINEQGYKVLDSHIGAIYGDSITLERQVEIYMRLAEKGFAATNIVLGVGSFTYQYNTRDTLGLAAKGAWFEITDEDGKRTGYPIYKDPVTDDGTKKSLKGFQVVYKDEAGEYYVKSDVTEEEAEGGELRVIYSNGSFQNVTTFSEIRELAKK